jgi:hypothetical protein
MEEEDPLLGGVRGGFFGFYIPPPPSKGDLNKALKP